jgi:gluconokinase
MSFDVSSKDGTVGRSSKGSLAMMVLFSSTPGYEPLYRGAPNNANAPLDAAGSRRPLANVTTVAGTRNEFNRMRAMTPSGTPGTSGVSLVVAGVSGSGKTTVAREFARHWGYVYLEADALHGAAEIEKMATGHPLDDHDRLPWLRRVGEEMRTQEERGHHSAAACSALKRSYRDVLRGFVANVFVVMLDGPIEVVRMRVESRHHSFMPASLLESQYATLEELEPDEFGARVDLSLSPSDIVAEVALALEIS